MNILHIVYIKFCWQISCGAKFAKSLLILGLRVQNCRQDAEREHAYS